MCCLVADDGFVGSQECDKTTHMLFIMVYSSTPYVGMANENTAILEYLT